MCAFKSHECVGQAHSQALRFGEQRGARFLFLMYVQTKLFWAQHNLGEQEIFGGALPPWLRACV